MNCFQCKDDIVVPDDRPAYAIEFKRHLIEITGQAHTHVGEPDLQYLCMNCHMRLSVAAGKKETPQ